MLPVHAAQPPFLSDSCGPAAGTRPFGWLYLLLVDKRPVEPHYVITIDRPSIGVELRAMARLKQALSDYPECRALLRPSCSLRCRDLSPQREDGCADESAQSGRLHRTAVPNTWRATPSSWGSDELELPSIERDSRLVRFFAKLCAASSRTMV